MVFERKETLCDVNALDDRYVTKDFCTMKKESYVRKELCDFHAKRIDVLEETINEIRKDITEINKALHNHVETMGADIAFIKGKIISNGNGKGTDIKTTAALITIITILVTIIQSIIT